MREAILAFTSKRMVGFSPFPLFVVMMMTPLAAFAPYAAAEDASFITDTDSISLGLISFRSPLNIIPSTTSSGEVEVPSEVWPLISNEDCPLVDELRDMLSPAIEPRR